MYAAGNSSDTIQLIPDLFPIVPLKLPFFRGDGWGQTVDPRTFCYVRTPLQGLWLTSPKPVLTRHGAAPPYRIVSCLFLARLAPVSVRTR